MPKFKYAGVTADGGKRQGRASTPIIAERRPARCSPTAASTGSRVKERPSFCKIEITKTKVKRTEIMHFSRQLARVRAGRHPDPRRASTRSAPRRRTTGFREVLADIDEALRSGETFSDAVAAHPDVFPDFYIDDPALGRADRPRSTPCSTSSPTYIERDETRARKIKSALTYPIVIIVVAVVAVVVLVDLRAAQVQGRSSSLDAKLPLRHADPALDHRTSSPTTGGASLGGSSWSSCSFVLYLRTDQRAARDATGSCCKLPVHRRARQYTLVERFCRILGSMVALRRAAARRAWRSPPAAPNNVVYQEALDEAREAMMRGEGMAAPIRRPACSRAARAR